jgi:hypothetical protein
MRRKRSGSNESASASYTNRNVNSRQRNVFAPYLVMVLAPLLVAAAVIYVRGLLVLIAQPTVSRDQSATAPPQTWIPFAADLRIVNERGHMHYGGYFRASDGSFRSEDLQSPDTIRRIDITNIPTESYYSWTPRAGWTRRPTQLPSGGWHPPTTALKGRTLLEEKFEGFEAVRKEYRDGRYQIDVPQLNYFTVAFGCSQPGPKCVTINYFNIRQQEQPAELFLPPPGAPMTYSSQPGGIVGGQLPK